MCAKVDFSFDERVARRYDHQRAHPEAVSRQVGEAVSAAVGPSARVLEIGVGTGRIAKPVAAAGCEVFGFDISSEMLLEVGAGPGGRLHTFQGDMHVLPFAVGTFDAVLAVHVLHLTRNWQDVLGEAARVLRPGGVFIQGDDWVDPQSVIGQLRDTLRRQAVEMMPEIMPPSAGVTREDVLQQLGGGETYEVVAAEWTTQISPAARLRAVEAREDAESWVLSPALFEALMPRLWAYAEETWDDLEAPQTVRRQFKLKVTTGMW